MSFASKYQKHKFNVNTSGFEYHSLSELFKANGPEAKYTIRGLYVNTTGKYGEQPLAATESFFVNLPGHLLPVVKDMINDSETVDEINGGHAGFVIYAYTGKNGVDEYYSVNWIDV